jgi:hypothetical protein
MKSALSLFLGVLVAGCGTESKENHQQSYEATLSEGRMMMSTLQALDTGDIRKTRKIGMISLQSAVTFLPIFAAKAQPTPEQKQEERALAREILDYMVAHQEELLPSAQPAVRGLQRILTQPEEVRRLTELSNYLAEVKKKMSETAKP